MSSLVPKKMLAESDIHLEDLASYQHFNNHDEVIRAVLSGDFDAGAVKETVFEKYNHLGLREISRSRHIAEHVFVASNQLSSPLKEKISKLLLELTDTEEGKNILLRIKPKSLRLKPAIDSNFNSLRNYLDIKARFKWSFQNQ